ncbi:hypothetical protein FOL47_004299 [Perkinsus chesapeaki]|uniref:Poly(A)-specific ribonuclease PARN n=1 Tax=Perkinsus chesapeaki TaxID=330153 RepID=A0A7J6M3C5_PERCH|nr:hypothetical protein FOL47_004299 [Perkinsus chesapeaki]
MSLLSHSSSHVRRLPRSAVPAVAAAFTRRSFSVVTRHNWDKLRPVLLQEIHKCDFLTIDFELTGLLLSQEERHIGLDKVYEAYCSGARNFLPLQMGLCAVTRQNNGWRLAPFSVYMWPQRTSTINKPAALLQQQANGSTPASGVQDSDAFMVSVTAMNFLSEAGFDLNECIRNGVGWLRPDQERTKKSVMEQRIAEIRQMQQQASSKAASEVTPVSSAAEAAPPEIAPGPDLDMINSVKDAINEWLRGDPYGTNNLEVPMSSAFQRLLMHSVIAAEYPNLYSYSSRRASDGERMLVVYRSQDQLYDTQIKEIEADLEQTTIQVGVRSLLDAAADKVIVGHNCFLDVLHAQHRLYEALPSTVSEFKDKWTERFKGGVLDTKYLAETHEFLSPLNPPATLKSLCDFMAQRHIQEHSDTASQQHRLRMDLVDLVDGETDASIRPPHAARRLFISSDGSSSESDHSSDDSEDTIDLMEKPAIDMSHDAGYDAMMTALVCLLQLAEICSRKGLDINTQLLFKDSANVAISKKSLSIQQLLPVSINRVRLVKSQPNVLNIAGRDETDMQRHFYMTNFPTAWTKWEVMKVWSPVWVNIAFVQPSAGQASSAGVGSCWVMARNDEDAESIRQIYDMMDRDHRSFDLYTYDEYQKHKDNLAKLDDTAHSETHKELVRPPPPAPERRRVMEAVRLKEMKRNALLTDFFKKVENPKSAKIPKTASVTAMPDTVRLMAWNADSLLNRIKNKETAKEIARVVKERGVNVLCVCEVRMSCESCSPSGTIDRVNSSQGAERDLVVNFLTRQCGFDQLYFSLRRIKQAGVGMFMRKMPKPDRVQFKLPGTVGEGFHHPEGRVILADFDAANLQLLLTYVPNNGWTDESFAKRRRFDFEVKSFLKEAKEKEKRAIWLGDLNVAAKWDDVGPDPAWFRQQKQSHGLAADDVGQPGFTKAEQDRFSDLLDAGGLIDAYRQCHPAEDWDKDATWRGAPGKPPNPPDCKIISSSNDRYGRFYGKGMRIDYVLVPESMKDDIVSVDNLGVGKERKGFMGSDHAPLLATIRLSPATSKDIDKAGQADDTSTSKPSGPTGSDRKEESDEVVELDD